LRLCETAVLARKLASTRAAIALLALYPALVLALLASAVAIWRLHCEGFGCMGVGVAWFAWVLGFAVVLGIGLLARSKAAASATLAGLCRSLWWLQLLLGAALVAIWLAKRAG